MTKAKHLLSLFESNYYYEAVGSLCTSSSGKLDVSLGGESDYRSVPSDLSPEDRRILEEGDIEFVVKYTKKIEGRTADIQIQDFSFRYSEGEEHLSKDGEDILSDAALDFVEEQLYQISAEAYFDGLDYAGDAKMHAIKEIS